MEIYRDYFDIDTEYFPQVNDEVINHNPEIWKKYYPHETFVELLKSTVSVLSRKQKVSLWVEGAYGTGKSHAVLTLKKLLEASPEETRAYFDKYPDQLSVDLYNQFQQLKSGEQRILTVHRYGSSDIHGDSDLIFAIQESIQHALKENGMDTSNQSLKDAMIQWISDPLNKNFFDSLLEGPYRETFGGDDADAVIHKLQTYSDEGLRALVSGISKIARERQITMLRMQAQDLVQWIESVIAVNHLKAIVFIWDEFTEYFRNNMRSLTGFQAIVDMSATQPFYMLIVTHDALHIFPDGENEFGKIKDRFIKPICEIQLPDNMAFQLMGAAMTKKADPQIQQVWDETVDELYDRTKESRAAVKRKAGITDKELKAILPIHPYTALLLKYISASFDSNQRSMFDFIKNEHGEEQKGFQWFIKYCGPLDNNPFLTIDELWDFFYETGKDNLTRDIRSILDYYGIAVRQNLDSEERRILKAILMMQAISQHVGNAVDLLVPNVENINLAFEGSDLHQDAGRIAERLEREKILYQRPIGGGKFQFAARQSASNEAEIAKLKEKYQKQTTSELVRFGEIDSAVPLTGALKLRFNVKTAASTDLQSAVRQLKNEEQSDEYKLPLLITFAKNEAESAVLGQKIQEQMRDEKCGITFVDASITPLGGDLLEQYITAMAHADYQREKDRNLSNRYEQDAKDILKRWRQRIETGEFFVYSRLNRGGERTATLDQVYERLRAVNRAVYPLGLETGGAVQGQMWERGAYKLGVEAAVYQDTNRKGVYASGNENTKLEKYIGEGAWRKGNYWVNSPYLLISKIKIAVEEFIGDAFKKDGRVSIQAIYDMLKRPPYGFMPCNLSIFVLAFVLKEYVDGTYTYSDGLTNDVLTIEKLQDMIKGVMDLQITPNPRYRDKYIVTVTREENAFLDATSLVFGIKRNLCTSIEQTRERIRGEMKKLSFPIWSLKNILKQKTFKTDCKVISNLIDLYSDIANSGNAAVRRSDSDIANEIGRLCLKHPDAANDLKTVMNSDCCRQGMDAYVHQFEGGALIQLAEEVRDNGQYINVLRKRFDADAANWVWNQETAEQKIREVILEYRIIVESNKINPAAHTFDGAIREWCDKCKLIHISYYAAKSYWNELSDLMGLLFEIKKNGKLPEAKREKFLDQLKLHGEDFRAYCANPLDVFQAARSFDLEGLNESEIREVYQTIRSDVFTMEQTEYSKMLAQHVAQYKLTQRSAQLRALWREKTGTDSPKAWSGIYKMPILCMVPEREAERARAAFETIGSSHPDENAVNRALEYLQDATFYDALSRRDARDAAFRRYFVKSYDVLFKDLDMVRDYLMRTIGNPYNWLGSPAVDSRLKALAQHEYEQSGSEIAMEKIDRMSVDDVKRYLKYLIRENMTVGIEIIKDDRGGGGYDA